VSATLEVCVCAVPVTVKLKGLVVAAERPVTVIVLLWPATIDVGLKVQVAPEAQERTI